MVTMAKSGANWRNTHTHMDHTHSLTQLHQQLQPRSAKCQLSCYRIWNRTKVQRSETVTCWPTSSLLPFLVCGSVCPPRGEPLKMPLLALKSQSQLVTSLLTAWVTYSDITVNTVPSASYTVHSLKSLFTLWNHSPHCHLTAMLSRL